MSADAFEIEQADEARRLHADSDAYMAICQVDTPVPLVELVWSLIGERRDSAGVVVDLGAGDGRFSLKGTFENYLGIEIDTARHPLAQLPPNAEMLAGCAFDNPIDDADVAIGNPPYVRNQDLPVNWSNRVASILYRRTGVRLSRLANAYQYFFLQALASVSKSGLVALILPYDWIWRPSARPIREHIQSNKWKVEVFRLVDPIFQGVLTDVSVTIVDKANAESTWDFFEIEQAVARRLPSETPSELGPVPYMRGSGHIAAMAKRGLSPGSQSLFVLRESERARLGLRVNHDVVPCVPSLRNLPYGIRVLDTQTFNKYFRDAEVRCWLIKTASKPSSRVLDYLHSVPVQERLTSTCTSRPLWWKYPIPIPPDILISQSFKNTPTPKIVSNLVKATAVGGVAGIVVGAGDTTDVVNSLYEMDLTHRVVPYANGLLKIEIGQLNSLLAALSTTESSDSRQ